MTKTDLQRRKRMAFSNIVAAKSLQSCPTLCDPRDGSPPGSPVPEILQARTLEWVAISFSSAWKWKVKVKSLSRVRVFDTPWTAAYQAPPSMGFSRQEYWSGVPLLSPNISAELISCPIWKILFLISITNHIFLKNQIRWTIALNVKQFLENNIEYLGDKQKFLKQNTKALTIKGKINKLNYIKIGKDINKRMKRHTALWEEILVIHQRAYFRNI